MNKVPSIHPSVVIREVRGRDMLWGPSGLGEIGKGVHRRREEGEGRRREEKGGRRGEEEGGRRGEEKSTKVKPY